MKLFTVMILIFFAIFMQPEMVLAANAKADPAVKEAPVAIACLHSGALTFLTLNPAPDRQDQREVDCIILAGPTRPCTEFKSYRDGSYIFFGAPADGTTWTKFGRSDYQKMMFMGKPAELNSFQQVGEPWACVIDEVLYQEVNGVAKAIAATALRSYKAEDGKERRAQMCQRPGKEGNWSFAAENGKVYLQGHTGKISQIGWQEWRVATLPSGEKVLILMTKGMNKNAKWSGKRDGKLYLEK